MAPRSCGHRWVAPRVDAPDSLPVNHVCSLVDLHADGHRCACGAMAANDGRKYVA